MLEPGAAHSQPPVRAKTVGHHPGALANVRRDEVLQSLLVDTRSSSKSGTPGPRPSSGPGDPLDRYRAPVQRILIALGQHQSDLVKQAPGGLVAGDPGLSSELKRRNADLRTSHQPQRVQPGRQRQLRPMQDRPRRDRRLAPTGAALPQRTGTKTNRAGAVAPRANKPFGPAPPGQVVDARLVIGEHPMEVAEGHGGRRVAQRP